MVKLVIEIQMDDMAMLLEIGRDFLAKSPDQVIRHLIRHRWEQLTTAAPDTAQKEYLSDCPTCRETGRRL